MFFFFEQFECHSQNVATEAGGFNPFPKQPSVNINALLFIPDIYLRRSA
jgi:hypothetical protein